MRVAKTEWRVAQRGQFCASARTRSLWMAALGATREIRRHPRHSSLHRSYLRGRAERNPRVSRRLLNDPHGGGDRQVVRGGLDRDQLRQQAEDALAVVRVLGDAIALLEEPRAREAVGRVGEFDPEKQAVV